LTVATKWGAKGGGWYILLAERCCPLVAAFNFAQNVDALAHFKSLAAEITAVKDRVQNLIGGAHWPTVGAWKESVLRSILRRHLPPSLQIGSGFVLSEDGQSNQIDVLIYDDSGPILFRDGDLVIVTPDVVRAAIEVKTRIKPADLKAVIAKLDKTARLLRHQPKVPAPFFGIYSYEEEPLNCDRLLSALQESNGEFGNYEINCVSIGTRQFVRFWEFPPAGPRQQYSRWHCYDLDGIAQAYFVHNVIDHLFPQSVVLNNEIWYPIDGKESRLVASKPKMAGNE
jgi:hypothetical protein